jgi:hypothetical protein
MAKLICNVVIDFFVLIRYNRGKRDTAVHSSLDHCWLD